MSWQMEKYLYKWLGSHAKSALPTQKRRRAEVSSLKLVCNGPWPSFTASVTRSINDPAPRTAIRCQPCRYDRRAEWVPFTYLPTWFRRYATVTHIPTRQTSTFPSTNRGVVEPVRLNDKHRICLVWVLVSLLQIWNVYWELGLKSSNQWHIDWNGTKEE